MESNGHKQSTSPKTYRHCTCKEGLYKRCLMGTGAVMRERAREREGIELIFLKKNGAKAEEEKF